MQTLTHEEAASVRAIDPLMFQAIQPDTQTFLWHSVQRSEPDEDALDLLTYISYPVQDLESGLPMTASDEEVIADMKKHAADFCEPLRSLVCNIKPGTPITRIQLRDWISQPWTGGEGRVSLAGDAGAHSLRLRAANVLSSQGTSPTAGPMTMYRGEGVNHGILDAFLLAQTISSIISGQAGDANAAVRAEGDVAITPTKPRLTR